MKPTQAVYVGTRYGKALVHVGDEKDCAVVANEAAVFWPSVYILEAPDASSAKPSKIIKQVK